MTFVYRSVQGVQSPYPIYKESHAIEVSHLPLTRGISAARLLVQGASLADVMPLLGELAVGYLLFAVFEVEARKRGTLEVF